ncbi:MAG: HEAT repeat domain-containing protein [Acidobacteriota bacterium]
MIGGIVTLLLRSMSSPGRRPLALLLGVLAAGALSCATGGGSKPAGGSTDNPPAEAAGKERTVAQLAASLKDPDLNVRLAAVEELGHRAATSDDAVAAVVGAFSDEAPLVRRFAAGGLAGIPAPSTRTVLALARLLKDPENEPRESAARTLAALAPHSPADAVAELAAALAAAGADSQETVRSYALAALGGLGARGAGFPAVKAALERGLADPNEEVRGAAAAAAGEIGLAAPWTIGLLTRALADPVHDVRKQAVIALEKIGPPAAPATKAIARLLRGEQIYLRVYAADALTSIGPGARAALPDLKAMVKRGWKSLEDSKEMEAKDLPEAVARAIRSIEAKGPAKDNKKS